MKASRIALGVFIALVLVILILVMVQGIRDFVRAYIVVPIAYVLWIADLLIKSTPQVLFWGVMVGVAAFFAVRSLGAVTRPAEEVGEAESRPTRRGRIGFWMIQVYHARQSFFRMRFEEFFARLILDVIAFGEQTNPIELERRIEDGTFEPPQELQIFLRARYGPLKPRQIGLFPGLRQRLWWFVTGRRQEQEFVQPGTSTRQVEEALIILEDQLGVNHDYANQ